jgi:hypothetical protein
MSQILYKDTIRYDLSVCARTYRNKKSIQSTRFYGRKKSHCKAFAYHQQKISLKINLAYRNKASNT